jgi:hypothetical protein
MKRPVQQSLFSGLLLAEIFSFPETTAGLPEREV